jgi:hypothetical protein
MYPKIASVMPMPEKQLLVVFDNGVRKMYDCKPLLTKTVFKLLKQDWLFESVRVDGGGYGISWSDEIDLAESELWENGCVV